MKLFKIMLLVALAMGLYAKDTKWKKLKPVDSYLASAFHLKENVSYMEIRRYRAKKSKKAFEVTALYRTPLENYPQDVIGKFNKLTPKYSSKADIGSSYGNAFFIDIEGKMFQMDMRKDIVSLLGKIDSPAEAQLILWLNNYEQGQYYRKIAKGYETKRTFSAKGCVNAKETILVSKNGDILRRNFTYSRKGCKQRKHTQFVRSKKISYVQYDAIAIDSKENLYLLGTVKNSKRFDDYTSFAVLDKYTRNGKRLWSRKLKEIEDTLVDPKIVIHHQSLYIYGYMRLLTKYSLKGKKQSLRKSDRLKFAKKPDKKAIKRGEYLPEGLPDPKNGVDAIINAYAKDKKGNVYVAGAEMFYPSGSPDEVPEGECGNVETVSGALIAKLGKKGKTIWAKVIDADE